MFQLIVWHFISYILYLRIYSLHKNDHDCSMYKYVHTALRMSNLAIRCFALIDTVPVRTMPSVIPPYSVHLLRANTVILLLVEPHIHMSTLAILCYTLSDTVPVGTTPTPTPPSCAHILDANDHVPSSGL